MKIISAVHDINISSNRKFSIVQKMIRDWQLYVLALPGILFFIIFKYTPMWGLIIAFQDYIPYKGMSGSKFIGFENFTRFFSNDDFWVLMRNTLSISFLNLVLFFPIPIILSLMLNEVQNNKFKKVTQTIVYFPHFLSWVTIYGLFFILLNQTDGVVNVILERLGMEKVAFLQEKALFYPLLVIQQIWKDAGWGTVIFLAALAGIDPTLYEAARVDGASRLRQIWHITLPGISSVIVVLLILRLGHVMDVGFEQVFLMNNAAVSDISDVFETYVYRNGIQNGNFSFTAAVGLFKSLVATIMVISANRASKLFGQQGLY